MIYLPCLPLILRGYWVTKKAGQTTPHLPAVRSAGPLAATGRRDDFTHPRVGQAERLACHWQPNAFCGLAPTPTFAARGPKVREKKPGAARPWTLCGLLDFDTPLTKKCGKIFCMISACFVPFPLHSICFLSLSKAAISTCSAPHCG